ncbi:MAG: hypothetical protein ABIS69_11665 [Sediminibacterium sp.]
MIHYNYNLKFVNLNHYGSVVKVCYLINENAQPSYDFLNGFIMLAENISALRYVITAINEVVQSNNGCIITHVDYMARIGPVSTTFNIYNEPEIETIPTADFKAILEEYSVFYNTAPLPESKV